MVLRSTEVWFANANDSMGMVTYGTIVMMFSSNIWQLDFTPRTWVRWMIYLDALAFTIIYAGTCANDLLPDCWQRNSYGLAADLIWSFKDAGKYGYIAYKALSIGGYHMRWPCYAVAGLSLLLYWLLCYQAYGFSMPGCPGQFHSDVPRVVLYGYWTLVDVVATVVVVAKMRSVIVNSSAVGNQDSTVYKIIKMREEIRLLVASVGMLSVTVLSIVGAIDPTVTTLNIWRMVFVYVQLLLVMGSQKVVVGNYASSSQHANNASGGTSVLGNQGKPARDSAHKV
ncbi:hypothetical protein HDU78_005752 [Chytriomyces hyalinus]|nr:hypothetical protein HDU78_005752 [Chytriomyces hyalinus]KAJ3242927.1 hypothetical protein HDU77_010625 [Chytriomyces hyalinus]